MTPHSNLRPHEKAKGAGEGGYAGKCNRKHSCLFLLSADAKETDRTLYVCSSVSAGT